MPISFLKIKAKGLGSFLGIFLTGTAIANILAMRTMELAVRQSFVMIQVLLGISIGSLILSVYLFFLKKNVALLISVIVLKWPILVYVVYKMTEKREVSSIGIALGFLPLLMSALLWSFLQKNR